MPDRGSHSSQAAKSRAGRWNLRNETARDTDRIEAFSDAVIAIMLTLLALELLRFDVGRVKEVGLMPALGENWPSYFAFGLTFMVIGQIWITHHNLWRYIERVDQGIAILNLLLLGFVAITPFAAQVLAQSLAQLPIGEQRHAAAFYSAVMLGQAIAFNASEVEERSNTVTAIVTRNGESAQPLVDYCREKCGVVLGRSLGQSEGKGFRIAHMGHVNAPMILGTLSVVEMALGALGLPHGKGGAQAAVEFLAKSVPA